MAVYYIRKSGSDSNDGTTATTGGGHGPWLTLGKALGATGISSGDTVYVGAGVYRETVTVAMTSAVAETKIIGDVDGAYTGDAGEVQWSAWTTNDKTAPSSSSLISLSGRDYLTFINFVFLSYSGAIVDATTSVSTNITFSKCVLIPAQANSYTFNIQGAADIALNWTIDSCIILRSSRAGVIVVLPTSAIADYNSNVVIKNCLFIGSGSGDNINISGSGANTYKGGGVAVLNCTRIGGSGALLYTANTSVSTSIPCTMYNCFVLAPGSYGTEATTLGQIVEDYNLIFATNPQHNTTPGANTIANGSYAPLIEVGQSWLQGCFPRPFGSPSSGSSTLLAKFDNGQAPTYDLLGAPRPSGSGYLPSSGSKAAGAFEYYNGSVQVTSPTRTGSNAIGILGAGYQDFWLPVTNTSTTVSIYGRYDSTYAGALPQMHVTSGSGCGVSDASVAMAGAANNWEQLSLNFTPTSKGVVKIRLRSNDTSGGGWTYWDDFDTT